MPQAGTATLQYRTVIKHETNDADTAAHAATASVTSCNTCLNKSQRAKKANIGTGLEVARALGHIE